MKKYVLKFISILVLTTILISCDSGDDNPGTNTPADTAAPTFSGIVNIIQNGSTGLIVSWAAADDGAGSTANNIVYQIYVSTDNTAVFSSTVVLTSAAGATSQYVPNLLAATNYAIGVRAQDEASNIDTNTVVAELATATISSFSTMVQPIFANSCATSNCHTDDDLAVLPKESLNLDADVAYASLVNMDDAGCAASVLKLVALADTDGSSSYLLNKLRGDSGMCNGAQMPTNAQPLSAAVIQIISDWIIEGAQNN